MEPAEFIIQLVQASPNKQIMGKKRLQKIAMLTQSAGYDTSLTFVLHHYGPYSSELSNIVDDLCMTGILLQELEPSGIFQTFQSVFRIGDAEVNESSSEMTKFLKKVGEFSTVELEVAATIIYFLDKGQSWDEAVEETKVLKPTKTVRPVLEKAKKIWKAVEDERSRQKNKRPSSQPN